MKTDSRISASPNPYGGWYVKIDGRQVGYGLLWWHLRRARKILKMADKKSLRIDL